MRPVPKIEVIDEVMAGVIRGKSGPKRLRIANGMYENARRMLLVHLRSQHTDWTEKQIVREAARRLSCGAVCGAQHGCAAISPNLVPMTDMSQTRISEPL